MQQLWILSAKLPATGSMAATTWLIVIGARMLQQLPWLLNDGCMLWEMLRLCRSDGRDRWLESRDIGALAVLCWLRGVSGSAAARWGSGSEASAAYTGGEGLSLLYLALACAPGLLLLVISALTREQVGRGDGLVLFALGLRGNPVQIWEICKLSFLLAGAAALVVVLRRRREDIPYILLLTPVVILSVTAEWAAVRMG